jgi:hypothetical protein
MAAAGPNPALVAAVALTLVLLTATWQELKHSRR